jgi:putative endonuclease
MSCYVYMLKSLKDSSYYVGISENPIKRLEKHNSGKLKRTAKNKPHKIVFTKKYLSYKKARIHEIWLKKKNKEYKDRIAQLAPPISGGVK